MWSPITDASKSGGDLLVLDRLTNRLEQHDLGMKGHDAPQPTIQKLRVSTSKQTGGLRRADFALSMGRLHLADSGSLSRTTMVSPRGTQF